MISHVPVSAGTPCSVRGRVAALPLAVSLLLAACAHQPATVELPTPPIANAYAEGRAADGPGAAALAWRDFFTDPALQRLIDQALVNNRDLRVAAARVQQAQAALGLQHAATLPSVSGQLGASRAHLPANINPLGAPIQGTGYNVGLGFVSWEIDLWNRLGQLQDAAFETAQAGEESRRAATLSLTTSVAQAYLALCELDERLALARQTEASRVESTRIFTRRVDVGSSSRLQLTQVQTLLTQAQSLVAQLQQARATLVQTLTLLVGTSLDLPERANALSSQPPIARLRSGLPSDLLQARPDIVAAEHQLRAAHAQVGAARAAFFPSITLTTVLGNTSEDLDKLFKSDSRAWLFSPSINLPIFDGGRRQNNLDLQEARRNEAVAQYEKSIQTAFREVNDALSDGHWLEVQQGIAEAAVRAQSERARLSERRFEAGSAAFLEVLDAQRDLLAATQQLVQVRRAVLASRVTLYAALGGGSLAANTSPLSQAQSSGVQP